METNGVSADRCRLLPQYIGEAKLQRYPCSSGKPGIDRPIYFIFVGRWSRNKGAEVLLNAFLRANFRCPVELWIVTRSQPDVSDLRRPRGKQLYRRRFFIIGILRLKFLIG